MPSTASHGHAAAGQVHEHQEAGDRTTGAHAHDATSEPHPATHEHSGTDHDEGQQAAPPPHPKPRGQTASMLYGPLVLPPASLGGMAHYNRIISVPAPCVDCTMTSMTPDLVYADGASANLDTGPMLHHAVLSDPMRNDPTCSRDFGIGGFGHRVFAAGNERTPMVLPAGFGVQNRSPLWVGIFEIMNESETTHVVFFKITVTHVPFSDEQTKPVVPVWLDVDNCNDSQFSIPAGESRTKWTWQSSLTGRIVGAGGHVHDGGVYLTLLNNATKKRMCTSYAGYGTKQEYMGTIESMSVCQHDRIGAVRAGEGLLIDAYYNATNAADDVMGIMLVYVYETNDLGGGSPPPAAYTADPPKSAPPPQTGGGHSH
jgi:hypothetical protein